VDAEVDEIGVGHLYSVSGVFRFGTNDRLG
jgi:hypothetical protein